LAYPAHALAVVDKSDYENLREDNRGFLLENSKLLAPFLSDGEDAKSRLQHISGTMHRGSAVFLEKLPGENAEDTHHLYDRLNELAGSGGQEILSSTPYLIPVEGFLELLKLDEESGTQVSFLTNSLASNNQRTVHSQYKKYRREILDTGAELYELNHQPVGELHRYIDTAPGKSDTITLHMKATVIDGQRCFIGTLNLDPRSIEINTEDVMYIESADLCGELRDYIAEIMLPDNAWQVSRNDDGDLQWKSHQGTTTQQPAQKFSHRVMDFLYGILPVEKQL
jgi:putative cardiolipin synthase